MKDIADTVKSKTGKGFTLLELLFVMAIIAIISGITTIGYFNHTRAMAVKSAVMHLTRNIDFARQSAIMQARKVYIIFDQDGTNAWYSVCRQEGVITKKSGPFYMDQYGDLSGISKGLRVYNLETGDSGLVTTNIPQLPYGWGMTVDPDIFNGEMATYGWELCQRIHLPRGYRFGNGSKTRGSGGTPDTIIFNPDGTAGDNSVEVKIVETTKASSGGAYTFVKVTISGTTGFVEVDMNAQ